MKHAILLINDGTFDDIGLCRIDAGGTLDGTFDGDGKLLLNVASHAFDEANAVAIQPDGKIVIVGYSYSSTPGLADAVIVRLLP